MKHKVHPLSNKDESSGFLQVALMWRGSVTPRILPTLFLLSCYPLILVLVDRYYYGLPHLDVTPFEYTGAVLGLVLVFRTSAGHERWWEARKLWGGIVNQSRNLAIGGLNYGPDQALWREDWVKWVCAYSFAVKESLRNGSDFEGLRDILTPQELQTLAISQHKPMYVANQMAGLLKQISSDRTIDGFAFATLEGQRSVLIDHVGGCERILKTPMPLVYAIKTRRFILMFLILLPFSLIEKVGINAVTIFFLVAYPLLSLDRIGLELQNPFDHNRLSHLPLDTICHTIKQNCRALLVDKIDIENVN